MVEKFQLLLSGPKSLWYSVTVGGIIFFILHVYTVFLSRCLYYTRVGSRVYKGRAFSLKIRNLFFIEVYHRRVDVDEYISLIYFPFKYYCEWARHENICLVDKIRFTHKEKNFWLDVSVLNVYQSSGFTADFRTFYLLLPNKSGKINSDIFITPINTFYRILFQNFYR